MRTFVDMLKEAERKLDMFSCGIYPKPTRPARLVDGKLVLCDEKGAVLRPIRCSNIEQKCHEDCAWFLVSKNAEFFFCYGLPIAVVWREAAVEDLAVKQAEYDARLAKIVDVNREAKIENYKSTSRPRKKSKPKDEK